MNKLYAGKAKRAITPTAEELAGFRTFAGNYDGTRGDIWARVLVLGNGEEKIAVISTELYYTSDADLMERLYDEYGLEFENVFFTGTQNLMALPPEEGAWYSRVNDVIAEAVGEAIEHMVPAKIGAGVGYSDINTDPYWDTPSGILYGTNMEGWADKDLYVLKIVDEQEQPFAALVNYSMQASVLAGNFIYTGRFRQMCSDVAGEISSFVEQSVGGDFMCAWAVGGGDLIPLMTSQRMEPVMNDDGTFEPVEKMNRFLSPETADIIMHYLGTTQGLDVLKTLDSIKFYDDTCEIATTSWDAELPAVVAWESGDGGFIAPVEGNIFENDPEIEVEGYELKLAVINDHFAFAGTDAIVGADVVDSIREELPWKTFFFGAMGGVYGYIAADDDADMGMAETFSYMADDLYE